MTLPLSKIPIQLIHDSGEILEGFDLVEGNGLCALYSKEDDYFKYVCMDRSELGHILATYSLSIYELALEDV